MANFNKNKIIAKAAAIVLLVILGLYSASKFYKTDNTEPWKFNSDNDPDESNWFYRTYRSYMTNGLNGTNGVNGVDGANNIKISQYQNYSNSNYGFSFQYPDGFNVASFEQGEGEVVLIKGIGDKTDRTDKSDKTNKTNQEIQIYISSFDEPEPLTYERLKRDLPDLVIEEPKMLTTTNDIKALIFLSRNESLGRTREIWFRYGGNLYQITTYPEMDPVLENIMKSWRFN